MYMFIYTYNIPHYTIIHVEKLSIIELQINICIILVTILYLPKSNLNYLIIKSYLMLNNNYVVHMFINDSLMIFQSHFQALVITNLKIILIINLRFTHFKAFDIISPYYIRIYYLLF